MSTWSSIPSDDTWRAVRELVETSLSWNASDSVSQELLGSLLALRPEFAPEARYWMESSLQLRPSTGYVWAKNARIRYYLGDTGSAFEASLRRAVEFGPSEPAVQRAVVDLGLSMYDEVEEDTRTAINRALNAGILRNPAEMLQISRRRGRLDVACPRVQGSQSGAHQMWLQLCQSREAT